MDVGTFCKSVCGGRCCYLRLPDEGEPIPCPHLTEDKTCGIYAERYREGADDLVVVGYFKSRKYKELDGITPATRPYVCGRMHQLLAAGAVPPDIAKGCCIAHPELLSKVEE